MKNNIGEARRSYALLAGKFTQDNAADFFNVAPSTYKSWEQGVGKLNGEILCQIADKYGTSVDYLLCRVDDPRPYPKRGGNRHDDPDQAALNANYESLNAQSRREIANVMKSYAQDPARRIEKSGSEHASYSERIGA